MNQIKKWRVRQLRDSFQRGKPCPAEELNDTDNAYSISRPYIDIKSIEFENSVSDIDNTSLKSLSDLSEPETANISTKPTWVLTKEKRPSVSDTDSDVDSPRKITLESKMDTGVSNNSQNLQPDVSNDSDIEPSSSTKPLGDPPELSNPSSAVVDSDTVTDVDEDRKSQVSDKPFVFRMVNETKIKTRKLSSLTSHERVTVDQGSAELRAQVVSENNPPCPKFENFLLESTNFQLESPLTAEYVDVEDDTTASEEDDDDYVIAPRMSISDAAKVRHPYDVESYQSICPHPSNNISKECECHVLDDGNFFYDQGVHINEEDGSGLELHYVKKLNNVIKTYKMPGAKVHFMLDRVRVYSTHLAEEYDRKNLDIDPLLSSAEYEMEKRLENMEIFPVDLFKDNKGLGINILGMGASHKIGMQKLRIFVKSIIKGGAAEENGNIQAYDQIIEVNGQSLVGVSQEFAAATLRHTNGVVHFIIGREKNPANSEIVKVIERARQLSEGELNSEDNTGSIAKLIDGVEQSHTFAPNKCDDQVDFATVASNGCLIGSFDICTQTKITGEQMRSNENLLSNLNITIHQARLNEDNMNKKMIELQVQADHSTTLAGELDLLSKSYADLQSKFTTVLSDFQRSQQLIEDFSDENNSLKRQVENLNTKYSAILTKNNSLNEVHQNYDFQQSEEVKYFENQGGLQESKLKPLVVKDEFINSRMHKADAYEPIMRKSLIEPLIKMNLNNRDIDDSLPAESTSGSEIEDQYSSKKVKYHDITLTNIRNRLDNTHSKNKIELKKLGHIANRKPATRSMMIGVERKDGFQSSIRNNRALPPDKDVIENNVNSCNDEKLFDVTSSKKIVGGFALPGKNEITLGIRPSGVLRSRKNTKVTNTASFRKTAPLYSENQPSATGQITRGYTFDGDSVDPKSNLSTNEYSYSQLHRDERLDKLHKIPLDHWEKEQVKVWLEAVGLGRLLNVFMKGGIVNGYELIGLDNEAMKRIGILAANDRITLANEVKSLRQSLGGNRGSSSSQSDSSRSTIA